MNTAKAQVRSFWETASCGEIYAAGDDVVARAQSQARERYRLEPYIFDFAKFWEGAGKDVLEVGVGMGADHAEWAKSAPRSLTGIDLTDRALAWTQRRLQALDLESHLLQADAEDLPFPDESFDIVYSWGVLHHTPDTPRAINEVHRVLRPGGIARLMLYNRYSITGALLWLRYGITERAGLTQTYHRHLESPGTQAFSRKHVMQMTSSFSDAVLQTILGVGDLLHGEAGKRHDSRHLPILRAVWPRWALKRFCARLGLLILLEVRK